MHDRKKIIKKWIEVKEIVGEGEVDLKIGQRIINTMILHDVVEVKTPLVNNANTHSPDYKTVVVLECVEYENN